jgi:hypothetical protein
MNNLESKEQAKEGAPGKRSVRRCIASYEFEDHGAAVKIKSYDEVL